MRRVLLHHEKVWKNGDLILGRPDKADKSDDLRLTETHLEQITANREFRPLAEVFQKILYLHLVPQLLKFPQLANREAAGEDPFGIKFLDRMMETPEKTRRSRLKKIEAALRLAVPELQELRDVRDEKGFPHLETVYQHWRPNAGRQREDQFSDGTLRLIGLLWTLLDGDSLLRNSAAFNNMAKASPVILLTDLDQRPCAPDMIADWLNQPKHPDFLFRVAVREVEAWLLACDEALRKFLATRTFRSFPNPEELDDPKMELLKLAERSTKRDIRDAIARRDTNGVLRQGPAYSSTLSGFVDEHWMPQRAASRCRSLERMLLALDRWETTWRTRHPRTP